MHANVKITAQECVPGQARVLEAPLASYVYRSWILQGILVGTNTPVPSTVH